MGGVEKLNELAAIMEKARQECAEKGKAAFSAAVADLFASHPKLEEFGWKQYTPYFNDGEPCEFSVHGAARFKFGGEWLTAVVEEGEEEPTYHEELYANYKTGKYFDDNPEADAAAAACVDIVKALDRMSEMAEIAFGDHVEVIVRRGDNGLPYVECEECEHD